MPRCTRASGQQALRIIVASVAVMMTVPAISFPQNPPSQGAGLAQQLIERLGYARAGADEVRETMSLVVFEKRYCLPPDTPNKDSERQFLNARQAALDGYRQRYRMLRGQLTTLFGNNGFARAEVLKQFPGANPIEDAFWEPWETAFRLAQKAINDKRAELEGISEVPCRTSPPQPPPPPPPPEGPGVDLPTVEERDLTLPTIPERFCSADQKSAVLKALRAVHWNAYMNYQDARELADAIAEAIDEGRGNTGNLKAMLPAAIQKRDFHAKRFDEIDQLLQRVSEMPVEDCRDQQQPAQPPSEPITQPRYQFSVLPQIPDVVCTEDEKTATLGVLRSARDAARGNYDLAAAKVIELADRIAKGDQSTTTSAAFQEASDAASAWLKQSQDLDAALTRAEAMPITDCTADPRTRVATATPVTPGDIVEAPRDESSQMFGAELPGGTVSPGPPNEESELAEVLRDALFSGPAPADAEPQRRAAEVEMYFLALGGSTGPVVQLFAVNRSGAPVALPADFMVLEPVRISPEAQARIGTLLQGMVDLGGRPQVLNAYCLEFLRQPPAAGTVLRMAGARTTSRFEQAKRVLQAAKRLHDLSQFSPDLAPEDYLHSIRQWAVWTSQEGFDLRRFTDAFVSNARTSYASEGQRWSGEIERAVRALVPNRWKDIQAVVQAAAR